MRRLLRWLIYGLPDRTARALTPRDFRRDNVLITAIPRSGSSLFVKLLNDVPGCVALNELSTAPIPNLLFRRIRRRIQRGLPVPNKYAEGGGLSTNTIQDTTRFEERLADVTEDRFVLAHKLTVPYLNQLEQLLAAGWPICVLVRHPLYALSSWKRCPARFTIAQLNPPHPSLRHIAFSSEDLDIRRVEVWNHYARRIDQARDKLLIVRYEDLMSDVQSTMARVCERYGLSVPTFEPLESRNRPDAYTGIDQRFRNLIAERCELSRFGYAPIPTAQD